MDEPGLFRVHSKALVHIFTVHWIEWRATVACLSEMGGGGCETESFMKGVSHVLSIILLPFICEGAS